MKLIILAVALCACIDFLYAAPIHVDPSAFISGTDVSNAYSGITLQTINVTTSNLGEIRPLTKLSDNTAPVYTGTTSGGISAFDAGGFYVAGQDSLLWSACISCARANGLQVSFLGDGASFISVEYLPNDPPFQSPHDSTLFSPGYNAPVRSC